MRCTSCPKADGSPVRTAGTMGRRLTPSWAALMSRRAEVHAIYAGPAGTLRPRRVRGGHAQQTAEGENW